MTNRNGRENHAQSLGPQHLVQRAESHVGDRRARSAASARRYCWTFRQEPRTGLSRHEPERSRADARGRGWLSVVGIKYRRSLSPAKYKATELEPPDLRQRALASKWMDWQLSVAGPAIFGCFWGLIRTPPEKRDHLAIEDSKKKTIAAMTIMDQQLAKTPYLAGDEFSYGDIPVGIIAYRYRQLVPERPALV